MADKIKPGSIIRRNSEIIGSDIDGETVMMSVANGRYYGINQVGSSIWHLLHEPMQLESIYAALQEEYEIDPETCEREVLVFLEDLMKNNIIIVD
ncbi:MAG TPA: lasso peptide biosynthesis PqqD family chaperone [Cryomorphaceae bacterium]|nr:PqqD family protein [Owenweeksia sp.]MBF98806.1 PqqD family protein [Owenweeksia sp.]HAD96306.1 lasso peptide biosynthesis PqqD family chaperone [Cryomorphaceae bacterium]HBF21894.1 lasso peptide biosynthesis PqqD family chaperone [Cryomorphaceae bacterium]|tara:strand:+ start:1557 stop:1841 length:285 start_codon:yes stop_codon:yes gene_type:complete